MGKHERRAYLEAIRVRYRRAGKADKSLILIEFCAVCGYHRKYALRLLNRQYIANKPSSSKPSPSSRYDTPELIEALRPIWMACPASSPVRYLKKHIPIQSGVWDVTQPGFMEADTVAHCGDSLAGDFVWSLTMTDICTGWTECRATWNKGADGVMTQIKTIQQALPFPIRGFDCDNGSEFLNWHLLRYFQSYEQPIKFMRSRPTTQKTMHMLSRKTGHACVNCSDMTA